MIFVILLFLLGGYVAVSVIASYWLLLAVAVSAMSLAGLLFWVDHDTKTNSAAAVSEAERHQRT